MINKESNKISTAKPLKSTKNPKAPNWLFENIAEASKNARKIYFLYISLLVYCAITVVSTTDRQIILDDTVRLPLINLNVWLSGFFIIAPFLIIIIFIYLQLYLHRLRQLITDLRSNYAPIKKGRLYPWVINFAEDPDEGFIGKLQIMILKLSLWWLLPIVLVLFSIWIIKKHELFFSYILGIMPILGTYFILLFWLRYDSMQDKFKFKIHQILRFARCNLDKFILICVMFIFEVYLLFVIIPFSKVNSYFHVDLSFQSLVEEPKEDYKGIYWLNLQDVHLEDAFLASSVLKRADLYRAHLQFAWLIRTNLQEANLLYAELERANCYAANLQGANLRNANMFRANLNKANLQGANLQGANLEGVNLIEADLRGAENLTIQQLSKAKTLYNVKLDPNLMEEIQKNYPHLLKYPRN